MRAPQILPDPLMEFAVRALTATHLRSPDPAGAERQEPRQRLRFTVSRISSSSVIAVRGEVDASNARDVSGCVTSHLEGCSQLLLDLSGLEFFGTEGLSALHKINAECDARGIPWLLVVAAHVSRVLCICDPEGVLPTAENAPTALATLDKGRHLHLL
jgi:anti-anti-sigma factor